MIDNLEFLVFDADGNDISDQIQNEALQPAFESAFGGFYEVVIDDDGSTDLNQKVKYTFLIRALILSYIYMYVIAFQNHVLSVNILPNLIDRISSKVIKTRKGSKGESFT